MRTKSISEENISSRIICTAPWRLKAVKSLPDYALQVEFIDGTQGVVKMKNLIMSKKSGVFSALQDTILFDQVHLEHGVATWPGEIDLAPDAMHHEIKKSGMWIIK